MLNKKSCAREIVPGTRYAEAGAWDRRYPDGHRRIVPTRTVATSTRLRVTGPTSARASLSVYVLPIVSSGLHVWRASVTSVRKPSRRRTGKSVPS